MKKSLNKWEKSTILGLVLFLAIGLINVGIGSVEVEANNTAQTLPFTQNWSNTGLITTNDDWSAVPGIVGYLGDIDAGSPTAVDPRTLLADYSSVSAVDVIANQTNPDTLASGGVAEFDGISNPTIALQGSGTADAPHIIVYLNTTGQSNVKFAVNIRDIDGSADDAVQPIDVQYRVGATGSFTSVPGGYIADATTGGTATQVTPLNLTLPAAANNQAMVQVRIMTTNAAGSDEWVGVDDINVSVGGGTTPPAAKSTYLDFTGNGRTDWTTLAIPTSGAIRWKIAGNPAIPGPNQAFIRAFDYGLRTGTAATSDVIVPQDYTGDKKTEVAVWRPGSQSIFYVSQFPIGTGGIVLERAVPFGTTGDNPNAVGDYDGDGKIDYAVARFNSTTGILTWYIMTSSTNTLRAVNFGIASTTDQFSAVNGGDFNGDGRDELVFLSLAANNDAKWFAGDAVTGAGVFSRQFGSFDSDFLITPADYTGDGRADLVAVRQASSGPQIWYINNSATNVTTATPFGIADTTVRGDIQVRGDYDGDGRQDIAVWRGSNQTFYYISSANGTLGGQKWGDPGDTPLGSFGIF